MAGPAKMAGPASAKKLDASELLQFAEILYRCTLCRSVPSLSVTEKNFYSHMYTTHLEGNTLHSCMWCELKFGTEEDLNEHLEESHTTTYQYQCSRQSQQQKSQSASKMLENPADSHAANKPQDNALLKVSPASNISSLLSSKSKRKRSIPVAYREEEYVAPDNTDSDNPDSPSVSVLDLSVHKPKKVCPQLESNGAETLGKVSSMSVVPSLLPKSFERPTKGNSAKSGTRVLHNFLDDIVAGVWNRSSSAVVSSDTFTVGHTATTRRDSPTDSADGASLRCTSCDFTASNYVEYYSHQQELHDQPVVPSVSEAERFLLIKEQLPDFLVAHPNGCIGRCELLERMSTKIQHPTIQQWGASCNRAMREIFPESQAARKGKYKKTYYFGVHFPGEPPDDTGMASESWSTTNSALNTASARTTAAAAVATAAAEDEDAEYGLQIQQSASNVRDTSRDIERLLTVLPGIVHWTGRMESCVIRDHLLQTLSEILEDPDVSGWGMQCNRAVRQGWPRVAIKRRGKYKTTCYFGVEMTSRRETDTKRTPSLNKESSCVQFSGSNGPPVVNAMDFIDETDRCAKFSKFKRSSDDSERNCDTHGEFKLPTEVKIKAEKADPLEDVSGDAAHEKVMSNYSYARPLESSSSLLAGAFELERHILLHPGPFVTARIIGRRFHRLVPSLERAVHAMETLQSHGLGQVFTLKHGNSKVFFKAIPSQSLEVPLSGLGVKLQDYDAMFSQRDLKLENTLHDRIKSFYPNLEQLSAFYRY